MWLKSKCFRSVIICKSTFSLKPRARVYIYEIKIMSVFFVITYKRFVTMPLFFWNQNDKLNYGMIHCFISIGRIWSIYLTHRTLWYSRVTVHAFDNKQDYCHIVLTHSRDHICSWRKSLMMNGYFWLRTLRARLKHELAVGIKLFDWTTV